MLNLRRSDTYSGEATLSKLFYLPSERESTLTRKNLLTVEANFFPVRVNPFLEVYKGLGV